MKTIISLSAKPDANAERKTATAEERYIKRILDAMRNELGVLTNAYRDVGLDWRDAKGRRKLIKTVKAGYKGIAGHEFNDTTIKEIYDNI